MSVRTKKRRAGHGRASAPRAGFPELFVAEQDEAMRAWWRRAWSRDRDVRALLERARERMLALQEADLPLAGDAAFADLQQPLIAAAVRYVVRTNDRMPIGAERGTA